MKTAPTSELARAGDSVLLASSGHVSTSPDRRGQIVDVLGDPGHETYLVRWLDGRLSVLSPAAIRLTTKGAAAVRRETALRKFGPRPCALPQRG